MKSNKNKERGLTLIELLAVTAAITLVVVLLLPAFIQPPNGRWRMQCMSNLKEVGLAIRTFSNDHQDKFPWAVPKARGGSLEYAGSTEVFRHFLAVSNELTSPKVLCCPKDRERSKQSQWNYVSNPNVSYFVGLDAD